MSIAIPRGWNLSCCSWISVDPFEYTWALQLMSLLPVTYVNYFPRGQSLLCFSGVKAWISHNPYEHTWALRSECGRFFRVSPRTPVPKVALYSSLTLSKKNWRRNTGFTRCGRGCFVLFCCFFYVNFNANFRTNYLVSLDHLYGIYPLSFWIFRFDTDKQTNKQTRNWSSVE